LADIPPVQLEQVVSDEGHRYFLQEIFADGFTADTPLQFRKR
jgi:hypothetical protein